MAKNRTIAILEAPESNIYPGIGKITMKLSFSIIFALLMVVSANSFIYLPFTPIPVFAGFKSGPMVLAGPTAGFIIGFAAAAYFCGFLYKNLNSKNNLLVAGNLLTGFSSCIAGVLIIYLFGFLHLFGFFFTLFPGRSTSDIIFITWKSGIEPFIMIDFLKILIIANVLELGKKRK